MGPEIRVDDIKLLEKKINFDSPVEIPRTKTCKCGSTQHMRISNRNCPLFMESLHTTSPIKRKTQINQTEGSVATKKIKSKLDTIELNNELTNNSQINIHTLPIFDHNKVKCLKNET